MKLKKLQPETVVALAIGRLLKQGRYGDEDGVCKYRTADGRRCAVGVLLTNREAKLLIEENTIVGIAVLPARLHEHRKLLVEMQHVHDHGFGVGQYGVLRESHRPFIDMILNMARLPQ